MEKALNAIGKGIVLIGEACVLGIAFFEVTKVVGETMVTVSDTAIDRLKGVQKTVGYF